MHNGVHTDETRACSEFELRNEQREIEVGFKGHSNLFVFSLCSSNGIACYAHNLGYRLVK